MHQQISMSADYESFYFMDERNRPSFQTAFQRRLRDLANGDDSASFGALASYNTELRLQIPSFVSVENEMKENQTVKTAAVGDDIDMDNITDAYSVAMSTEHLESVASQGSNESKFDAPEHHVVGDREQSDNAVEVQRFSLTALIERNLIEQCLSTIAGIQRLDSLVGNGSTHDVELFVEHITNKLMLLRICRVLDFGPQLMKQLLQHQRQHRCIVAATIMAALQTELMSDDEDIVECLMEKGIVTVVCLYIESSRLPLQALQHIKRCLEANLVKLASHVYGCRVIDTFVDTYSRNALNVDALMKDEHLQNSSCSKLSKHHQI